MNKYLFKLATVDDEPRVHTALDQLVDWNSLGFVHFCTYTDGAEALRGIERNRPDVVLVDIRMPGMGGLQLSEAIRRIPGYYPVIAVLSGYRDFGYAQAAMRYDVSDYLLKPLESVELHELLRKSARILEERKRPFGDAAALVRRLITDGGIGVQWEELSQLEPNFEWNAPSFRYARVVSFTRDHEAAEVDESTPEDRHIWTDRRFLGHTDADGNAHLVIADRESSEGHDDMSAWYRRLQRRFSAELDCETALLVAGPTHTLWQLPESYQQATAAMNRSYLLVEPKVVFLEEHRFESAPLVSTQSARDAVARIVAGRGRESRSILANDLDRVRHRGADTESFRMLMLTLVAELHRVLEELEAEPPSELSATRSFVQKLETVPLPRVERTTDALLSAVSARIQEFAKLSRHGLVLLLKQRIERSYSDDIHLKSIAMEYGVNPEYLGQQFKQIVGKGFREYLREVRVDAAVSLLSTTDLRVPEVGRAVGYTDPNYFADQFKKETGRSPSQLRRTE